MTEYNIIAELPIRNHTPEQASDLVDRLIDFHPAIATSPVGWCEATITVHAETIGQAVTVAAALLGQVVSIKAMTTEEFDRRPVADDRMPELVGVTEAAEQLGTSRQAVLQRLESGSLVGTKVGKGWAILASSIRPPHGRGGVTPPA